MVKKIGGFIRDIVLALLIGGMLFYFLYSDSSLHVKCDLQNDGTYSCQAIHELLGWGVTKLQTEQVVKLKDISHCSGTGTKRTCTPVPYFQTQAGNDVKMSSNFTGPKAVDLVEAINRDIDTGKSTIDHTGTNSAFFSLLCFVIVFPIAILAAFLKLFIKPNTNGPRTLISWKRD